MSACMCRHHLLGAMALLLSISGHVAGQSQSEQMFLKLPMNERRAAITQYPLQQQVDLYLLAMKRKHPPDLGLADAVAKSGSRIVPYLLERLRGETSEFAKLQLLDVLERMESLGYYSVSTDKQAMAVAEYEVSLMSDPQWKAMSCAVLQKIRSHQAQEQ